MESAGKKQTEGHSGVILTHTQQQIQTHTDTHTHRHTDTHTHRHTHTDRHTHTHTDIHTQTHTHSRIHFPYTVSPAVLPVTLSGHIPELLPLTHNILIVAKWTNSVASRLAGCLGLRFDRRFPSPSCITHN